MGIRQVCTPPYFIGLEKSKFSLILAHPLKLFIYLEVK